MSLYRTCPSRHGRMVLRVAHWHEDGARDCYAVWRCPVCFDEYQSPFDCGDYLIGSWWWPRD